MASMDWMISI